jgi:diadenosine tetraphosphate (Ap4A) HIT family hydrolase
MLTSSAWSGRSFYELKRGEARLHTHVMPRYALDQRPEWPFPYPEEAPPIDETAFRADVEVLRA